MTKKQTRKLITLVVAILGAGYAYLQSHQHDAPAGRHKATQQTPRRSGDADPAQDTSAIEPDALVGSTREVGHRNFANAKKVLPRIFAGMEEDIYCGCRYTGKAINLASCGYAPRKNAQRAARMEWEHVVPAEHLGEQRQCWQDGGRKNCSGNDPLFDEMEGDLNNLVPAVGEVNGDRSNMRYGVFAARPEHVYGQCASVPDFDTRQFQPREEVRGRLGRISLYMHTRYHLRMSRQDRQLWCAWARSQPVDAWEEKRDRRIIAVQGEGNPFVSKPATLDRVCGKS